MHKGYVSIHRPYVSIHTVLGKGKISENGFDRIFQTVGPFKSPFEALESLRDVLSYEMGFGISGRLNYVGSSKTYCFVNFYCVDDVKLMCN